MLFTLLNVLINTSEKRMKKDTNETIHTGMRFLS